MFHNKRYQRNSEIVNFEYLNLNLLKEKIKFIFYFLHRI